MKKKKIIGILIIIVILILMIVGFKKNYKKNNLELISIKSEKQLMSIYDGDSSEFKERLLYYLTLPFSLDFYPVGIGGTNGVMAKNDIMDSTSSSTVGDSIVKNIETVTTNQDSIYQEEKSSSSEKEHSTTNIQVENVDEADITKTDGDYIYSMSNNKVIITNVKDPANIKIESKIICSNGFIPEDMILYGNKLAVISSNYNYEKDTMVTIYNISDKANAKIEEQYTLYSEYYTSRCINGELFVICSGALREEKDKIVTYYTENNEDKEIGLDNIKYIKNEKSRYQTIISSINLDRMENVKVKAYLFNVENAYVSENNIYLLNSQYTGQKKDFIKDIKVLMTKGVSGYRNYKEYDWDYSYDIYTKIYKFKINEDGNLEYKNKTQLKGETINQFSLDEYQNNLRIALESDDGSRIVVLDEKLNTLGETEDLSEGENMYSTRFIGNKAYMVTYKNTDPLYVIDLSNPRKPKALGKLEIPGYSTYLHPYDENHLIGIGMETKEEINRNSFGKVISASTQVVGMKMALFDVSDVNNPIQISQTVIGDSRTTSAILTNHKALLFSKEKELLAIPVNKYSSDFELDVDEDDDISSVIDSYKNYDKDYIAEGYLVYKINLDEGLKLKGIIEHEKNEKKSNYKYSTYSNYGSKLLRGLWIENNLFTVSEDMMKVNNLDDLSLISELKIK